MVRGVYSGKFDCLVLPQKPVMRSDVTIIGHYNGYNDVQYDHANIEFDPHFESLMMLADS